MRVAVHPLIRRVVVAQGEVVRPVAERLAHRDALIVQRIGHASDGGLRAFLVDVPFLEMLERPRVHEDQRRVDDRPGIHQRAGKRVLDRLHRRVRAPEQVERVRAAARRECAGRQPLGADRDRDLRRAVLAGEIGQGAGLGEADPRAAARVPQHFRHHVAAKCARWEEHDLAVGHVRRDHAGDVGLRERRRRDDKQLRPAHGFRHISGRARKPHVAPAFDVLQCNRLSIEDGCKRHGVAPPEPHFVTLLGEIGGGGVRAVAAAQDCNSHGYGRNPASDAASCRSRKRCSLPVSVRGSASRNSMARGYL